jgi:eukaryotic-like serine/threonine-protein kinase
MSSQHPQNSKQNAMDEPSPATPISQSASEERLDSWKEIAAYLNRDVTTVQRWEKREGMPVHRHLHDRMGSVYGSRVELDTWARGRNLPLAQENGPDPALTPTAGLESERAAGAEAPSRRWNFAVPVAALTVVFVAGGLYWRSSRNMRLAEKDTLVLADFANTTGDTVFDGTLRQGLSVQLEQSPFLSIVPDQQVQQTLEMMGQKPDTKLTPAIAREVCQRTASAAVLNGSIAQIGAQYLLTVKAVNCASGESLASTESQASDKNHVLDALGTMASSVRNKLGESLTSVQKFDTPLERATTPSLEALKAYSLGWAQKTVDDEAAVSLFQRAIRLDPNFAMAYAALGQAYANLGEDSLAEDNTRKAFELRDRVTERERFYIESHYYDNVTGDLEKERQVYQLWAQTYPRDDGRGIKPGTVYARLGQYDKAIVEFLEALRLSPRALRYAVLAEAYLSQGRLQEARATADEALAKNFHSDGLRGVLYDLAFLQNDEAGMAQQAAWSAGKPGEEGGFQSEEGFTAAYSGRLGRAREFWRQAIASSERANDEDFAVHVRAGVAVVEALFGNADEARQLAQAALGRSRGQDVRYISALALAITGDVPGAEPVADDLAKRYPEDTIVNFSYLPTIHALVGLSRNDAAKAIDALQVAAPYELGSSYYRLFPVYVRGEAYLAARQGREAAAEFQKILDHRGIVLNEPIGALAHLQIGRAYAMQGETAKAKAAYQDFLTLWKDADPDIPILKQAKAEYAKLQ